MTPANRWAAVAQAKDLALGHPDDKRLVYLRTLVAVALEAQDKLPRPILADGRTDADGVLARLAVVQTAVAKEFRRVAPEFGVAGPDGMAAP